MPSIYCPTCEAHLRQGFLAPVPGEYVKLVSGRAIRPMVCDLCNQAIDVSGPCCAVTFYTDEVPYEPWEHEYLTPLPRPEEEATQRAVLDYAMRRGRASKGRWFTPLPPPRPEHSLSASASHSAATKPWYALAASRPKCLSASASRITSSSHLMEAVKHWSAGESGTRSATTVAMKRGLSRWATKYTS